MSVDQDAPKVEQATTYVYAHPIRDPILEEKRFTSTTEGMLEYKGRKVLYSYAEASAISFCSASGANYAGNMNVKGYVVRWQFGTNERGEAQSEIQRITDKKEQEEISQILWPGSGSIFRVNFD